MKVELGQRGDYAVRAMLALARSKGERRRSREIAASMDIPEAYLPHILGRLVAAGLVVSEPGRKGGYDLARSPAGITMLEVIEAVEGPLHRERCALSGGPCHWGVACAVHPFWARAQDAFMEQLRTTTLQDIATEDDRLATLTS